MNNSANATFDPTDLRMWARAFARHVYCNGGPLQPAPKHAQRAAKDGQPAIKTWADIGRRMFPLDFDEQLAWWFDESGLTSEQARYEPKPGTHQVEAIAELCEFLDVGDIVTIYEACQILTMQTGDAYWNDVHLHAIDLHHTLAIFPDRFQLVPAGKYCSVKGRHVRSTWQRVA